MGTEQNVPEVNHPITQVMAVLERIENKLAMLEQVPEEVQEIRAQVIQMREDERQAHETWRDAIYRTVTTLAGLIKPEKKHD